MFIGRDPHYRTWRFGLLKTLEDAMRFPGTRLGTYFCVGLLTCAGAAFGDSIAVFNTGVDGSGTPLLDGAADSHYSLVLVPGGPSSNQAKTSATGYPVPPWIGDDALSAWIGPTGDSQLNGPAVLYDYQTTFTLSAAGTVAFTGQWATDDPGVNILINGVGTGATSGGFTSWTPFSISEPGQSGVNTIDFQVINGSGPTGLRVEFESAVSTPLPGTALAGTVLLGSLCMAQWYRRRVSVN